jgi:hypothetical protein
LVEAALNRVLESNVGGLKKVKHAQRNRPRNLGINDEIREEKINESAEERGKFLVSN